MRIKRVELRVIRMPLVAPFETSFGREAVKHALILRLEGDSQIGYGECVAGFEPRYSYETLSTAQQVLLSYITPTLLRHDFRSPEELVKALQWIRGHNMAKAAAEMALWDLFAREEKISLSRLLGGTRNRVSSGVSVGIQESVEMLLRLVGKHLREGYKRIKIKIKPGLDVELAESVRREYPDIPLMVDANSAYTLADAPHLRKLDDFRLLMIEQPLGYDDIVDHAQLQKQLQTPICLDESIHSLDDARRAVSLESCRIINIKPGRVGGHLASKRIHDYCMGKKIPVWCGGMLETGVGRAHNVAIATLPNFTLPGDISASNRYFKQDIVDPPFELDSDGTIRVPRARGIGVEVVEERLEKATIKRFVRRAKE